MDIVSKLWGFCNKLRHDGVDPSDYIEQLTYLLFLKMAKERGINVPTGYGWQSLLEKDEDAILGHLDSILVKLKNKPGILGDIFADPVSRVRNGKILKSLVLEIDSIFWTTLDADVVGLAFEELIGKVANEGKKGAGQYFTPRPLISAIVNVMQPDAVKNIDLKVADVATGTAGFLVVAYEWLKEKYRNYDSEELNRIANKTYFGQELVQRPRRLALMNMFLHGVAAEIELRDAIYQEPTRTGFDCILTNPPFGNKGANQIPHRNFPIKTSDKQLNFIQHIIESLSENGRAAIVLPDSCLSSEPAKKIWQYYLDKEKSNNQVCNVHTILKLPEGVFAAYANGIKACVIFLQKGKPTKETWIFDARRNVPKITTRSNVLSLDHFEAFIHSYGSNPNGSSKRIETEKFKPYKFSEIQGTNYDLSFVQKIESVPVKNPINIIDEMILDYEQKIKSLKQLRYNLLPRESSLTKPLDYSTITQTRNSTKRKKTAKVSE